MVKTLIKNLLEVDGLEYFLDNGSMKSFLKLIACIAFCQAAGVIGSLFTMPAIPQWYEGLAKPSFRPPNWVFGPVWITLYLLMGISVFLVWQKAGRLNQIPRAAAAFFVQLLLNTFWSVAFFGLRSPFAGAVVIVLLLAAILWMMAEFYRVSRAASFLQIPYAMWVGFASALNIWILALN